MSEVGLVYFDVDGVIVTDRSTRLGGADYIPPGPVFMLLDLLGRSGALLVMASTWRRDADSRAKFARVGIGEERYFRDWRTPDLSHDEIGDLPVRGQEIDRHVREHQPKRYVIVDDDPGMLPHQKPFHIQVDPAVGLTWANVEDAVTLLRG